MVPQMLEDLDAAVREANRDPAVKVVVLRGAGRARAGLDSCVIDMRSQTRQDVRRSVQQAAEADGRGLQPWLRRIVVASRAAAA
jgi:enoyl-CoA hydratase/carnithine racemase